MIMQSMGLHERSSRDFPIRLQPKTILGFVSLLGSSSIAPSACPLIFFYVYDLHFELAGRGPNGYDNTIYSKQGDAALKKYMHVYIPYVSVSANRRIFSVVPGLRDGIL